MMDNVEMIERIQGLLGSDCSLEDATTVYHALRANDRIEYDERDGLVFVGGLDLLTEAVAILDGDTLQ